MFHVVSPCIVQFLRVSFSLISSCLVLSGLVLASFGSIVVRLERVEHGRSDQQVGQRADDQRQSSHVLSLHRKTATEISK